MREVYLFLTDRFSFFSFFFLFFLFISFHFFSFYFFSFFDFLLIKINSFLKKKISKCKRIGSQCWVLIAIIQTETLLCIKWGKGLFPNPAPPMIVNGWIIFICLFVLFTLFRFIDVKSYFFPSKPKTHRNHKHD